MNTSEVLYRAADLIEERGWAGFGNWTGADNAWGVGRADAPLCLEGGIYVALGRPEIEQVWKFIETCPAAHAVHDYLGYDRALWKWNDADERTATEVIETLRAAAVIEAARETEARLPHGPRIPQPADQRPGGAA